MDNKEELKHIYVYNRKRRVIHEVPVEKIEKGWVIFKYPFVRNGEDVVKECAYDLNRCDVQQIDPQGNSGLDPWILVSKTKESLAWIKDSDVYVLNRIESELMSTIRKTLREE